MSIQSILSEPVEPQLVNDIADKWKANEPEAISIAKSWTKLYATHKDATSKNNTEEALELLSDQEESISPIQTGNKKHKDNNDAQSNHN